MMDEKQKLRDWMKPSQEIGPLTMERVASVCAAVNRAIASGEIILLPEEDQGEP